MFRSTEPNRANGSAELHENGRVGRAPEGPAQRSVWHDLTIAVPAYARPVELTELLRSMEQLDVLPGEMLICEDGSEERPRIREIVATWTPLLGQQGCKLTYIENERNLGYDGNLRKLFGESSGSWVMLVGNDDLILQGAVREVKAFTLANPDLFMVSASYLKFRGDPERIVGQCRLSDRSRVYDKSNASPAAFVKLAGFVGGLVFRRLFAVAASTDAYDGTLYYQMYLAALAYCSTGIGYISAPTVASRVGNAPLFGAASAERAVHQPGRYSAEARLAMWEGILRICQDVERQSGVPLVHDVRRELGRQSFHVFEVVAVQGRPESRCLVRGLARMGLMRGAITWTAAAASLALGRSAGVLFRGVRCVQAACTLVLQRLRATVRGAAFPR